MGQQSMPTDFVVTESPAHGLQRLRAGFAGHAYDPHRHETYAIGVTEAGCQAFRYRGADRASTRGQCMVLHPDETHDGHAVLPDGFRYRMLYIEPGLIAAALPGGRLPHVRDPVIAETEIVALLDEAFSDFPLPLEDAARVDLIARLADVLSARGDDPAPKGSARLDWKRLADARELIDADAVTGVSAARLEHVSGLDRFELARQFRRAFGTSPYRYLVGRRLLAAQRAIAAGEGLAAAAAGAGFADQSHLTRHFKSRFGITPGRYAALIAGTAAA